MLTQFQNKLPSKFSNVFTIDLESIQGAESKAASLIDASILKISQSEQFLNPDSRILVGVEQGGKSCYLNSLIAWLGFKMVILLASSACSGS